MVRLSVVMTCASIITLRVTLTCMGAFLLNEDALKRSSSTAVCHHNLLRSIKQLRVVLVATAPRIVLVDIVLHLNDWLPLDDAFRVDTASFD